jgi:hypothetical protein
MGKREEDLHFLETLAATLYRAANARWEWDRSGLPHYYRLVISTEQENAVYQIEAASLEDQEGEAFRHLCMQILDDCLKRFPPRRRAH